MALANWTTSNCRRTIATLIATVHYYNPFAFTHQGTPWTAQKEKLGVTWMGTEGEVKAVEQELAKVTHLGQTKQPPHLHRRIWGL